MDQASDLPETQSCKWRKEAGFKDALSVFNKLSSSETIKILKPHIRQETFIKKLGEEEETGDPVWGREEEGALGPWAA